MFTDFLINGTIFLQFNESSPSIFIIILSEYLVGMSHSDIIYCLPSLFELSFLTIIYVSCLSQYYRSFACKIYLSQRLSQFYGFFIHLTIKISKSYYSIKQFSF
jgi:hypothetical protein